MSHEHSARLLRAAARVCWKVALLLAACSPIPPAGSGTPRESPSDCPQSDVKWQARERERQAEIVRLHSELQQHPDNAADWAALGKAYGSDDASKAIDAFQHATRLAPKTAKYWQQLGRAWGTSNPGDPRAAASAQAAFQTCAEVAPEQPDCYYSLGSLHASRGDHSAALQSFARAAELGDACENRMAEELLALGRIDEAEALVQKELARIPHLPANLNHLYLLQQLAVLIASQRGDVARARAGREQLAEYAAGVHPEIAFNLGSQYALEKPPRQPEAEQLLRSFAERKCGGTPAADDCFQCATVRDLLSRLARRAAPPSH